MESQKISLMLVKHEYLTDIELHHTINNNSIGDSETSYDRFHPC